jgi:copper chaperone CopZ
MNNSKNEKPNCCKKANKNENTGFLAGLVYGLIPHSGCIAFIIFTVLGVTAATTFFKPLLLNPYFFYILILLSFVLATISAIIYLKKQGFITFDRNKNKLEVNFSSGLIKRKWKYLSILYGTTISTNLILFMIIFPVLANTNSGSTTFSDIGTQSLIRLQVDIPCSGHAPLITEELKKINGITNVKFSFPNLFDVSYDSTKTTKQQILSLDVFNTYKATVIEDSSNTIPNQITNSQQLDNGKTGCGSSCGSSCGCGGK